METKTPEEWIEEIRKYLLKKGIPSKYIDPKFNIKSHVFDGECAMDWIKKGMGQEVLSVFKLIYG